ncbi:mRNA cap guanine-N7 methyltransferase [Orbilia brochopaga]|uniref:mRNA cap guanine-N(7) methyltransferase n=1 Tax=Orbilia brochopaga TaxID=3140254 RepID=A0AAV9V5Z2_9PEZI
MYDPIHDRYTSVTSDDRQPSSPLKPRTEDGSEPDQNKRHSDASAHLQYDDDGSAERRSDEHRPSQSLSPERKRKRDFSPGELPPMRTREVKDEPGASPADYQSRRLFSRDEPSGTSQDSHVDEQERKRLRRYEGEKDRAKRVQGHQREVKAGAYARREGSYRNDQPNRPERRNSNHGRRSPPHFRYRDAPPPPHLVVDPKFKDPEPEKLPERPRSPPRKFKRPGARYSQAERDALHRQQQQQETEREREASSTAASRGVDDVVRSHYNAVPERGKEWRKTDSKIRGLRSFNNWVKSTLIQKFAGSEESARGDYLKVLDIGCGKGGDLLKWKSAPQAVELYVGVDSADVSISQAKDRFVKMKDEDRRRNRGRPSQDRFHAEFFILDAWSEPADKIPIIRDVGFDSNVGDRWGGGGFDVVSLMFCMHYAFETEEKIRGMLRNVSGALRRGGRFIGTIPSSDKIYEGIKNNGPEFGNSLYKVSFPKTEAARKLPEDGTWRPAWGWKYSFFLEESVEDVPEYVVPWEAFRGLAFEFNLKLEYRRLFEDIWADEKDDRVLGPLSERMGVKRRDGSGERTVQGEEWEACKVYMGFCFRKI